jgi:hypothetical protein
LGLERYEPALLDEGFESIQDLRNATMEDYLAVGLRIGHARRLITAMAQDLVAIDAGADTVETRYYTFLQSMIFFRKLSVPRVGVAVAASGTATLEPATSVFFFFFVTLRHPTRNWPS